GNLISWDAGLSPTLGGHQSSFVLGLQLNGEALYIAGEFEIPGIFGNSTRRDLVAVDARTGRLLPWNPNLDGGVSAVAVAGRTVVAGFLSSPGGVTRQT